MKNFAKLVYSLDQTTKTNKKIDLLIGFLKMPTTQINFGALLYFQAGDQKD